MTTSQNELYEKQTNKWRKTRKQLNEDYDDILYMFILFSYQAFKHMDFVILRPNIP